MLLLSVNLHLLQVTPDVFISPKYGSKNASIVICKTTQAAENIVNILLAATHSFRQLIIRHVQRFQKFFIQNFSHCHRPGGICFCVVCKNL